MAIENERSALESKVIPEPEDRRTSAADYLISARSLSQKMVDRGRRQAEEILRDARARAEEIVAQAKTQAEEILAKAEQEADKLRSEAARETTPVSSEDQEHAVRCVEACFDKLRQQHLDAIDLLNAEWQQFLCGLYTGEKPAAEETPEEKDGDIPADLSERVSAIADAMGEFEEE